MANYLKVRSGLKNQKTGGMFEDAFLLRARSQGIAINRFPDGCKSVGKMIVRVKTPFDFICSYKGKAGFFDTKCFEGDHLTPSQIKDHQLDALLMHERQGIVAGYIVYFRQTNLIVFYSASALDLISKRVEGAPARVLGTIMNFDVKILFLPEDL